MRHTHWHRHEVLRIEHTHEHRHSVPAGGKAFESPEHRLTRHAHPQDHVEHMMEVHEPDPGYTVTPDEPDVEHERELTVVEATLYVGAYLERIAVAVESIAEWFVAHRQEVK